MQTGLNSVALANEVLPEEIGDVDVLMPRIEAIKTAVGILLEQREIAGIVLIAIVAKRAKEPRAEIVV